MARRTVRHGIAITEKAAAILRRFRDLLVKKHGRLVSLSEAIETAVVAAQKRR